jgi:hypothetical protein
VAARVPPLDRHGSRAPTGVELPAVLEAEAAGLETEHRAGGRDARLLESDPRSSPSRRSGARTGRSAHTRAPLGWTSARSDAPAVGERAAFRASAPGAEPHRGLRSGRVVHRRIATAESRSRVGASAARRVFRRPPLLATSAPSRQRRRHSCGGEYAAALAPPVSARVSRPSRGRRRCVVVRISGAVTARSSGPGTSARSALALARAAGSPRRRAGRAAPRHNPGARGAAR